MSLRQHPVRYYLGDVLPAQLANDIIRQFGIVLLDSFQATASCGFLVLVFFMSSVRNMAQITTAWNVTGVQRAGWPVSVI